jgi:3-oxoacyl-[acyl-carrier protein] reductase
MDLGLRDRVYVLTGASRGLGFATAEALVREGAKVVVSGRTPATVETAVAALGEEHAAGVTGDLGDPGTGPRLVAAARERFGRLHGALISVGGPPRGTATGTGEDAWAAAFHTIFLGTVRLARLVAETIGSVAEDRSGRGDAAIGIVLSTSVRVPLDGLAISNGLRPGLAGFAKDLATELGPRGIRVVSLLPGRILTDRNLELLDNPEARTRAAAAIPLRRLGDPAEFGRVAAFALSPAASYLTGVALPVDGGAIGAI